MSDENDALVSDPVHITHPFPLVYEWAWDRLRNHRPPPVSARDAAREDFTQETSDGVFTVTWELRPPRQLWRAAFTLHGLRLAGEDVELTYINAIDHDALDDYGRAFLAEALRLWGDGVVPLWQRRAREQPTRERARSRETTKLMVRQAREVGLRPAAIATEHGYSVAYVRELLAEIEREERAGR